MMQLENQHGTNPPIDFDITRIIANLEEHVQKFTAPGIALLCKANSLLHPQM